MARAEWRLLPHKEKERDREREGERERKKRVSGVVDCVGPVLFSLERKKKKKSRGR